MSLWSRIANAFRGDSLNREIQEELESHIEEAIDEGRDPVEARRAFGPMLRQREASHQIRVAGWLESLRVDAVFGWRQLKRNRTTSIVAILSLALAMGACVAAFWLIDALLLRPLPVASPEQLYAISFDGFGLNGAPYSFDSCSYPMFCALRATVKNDAELIAVSYTERTDLTYASDQEMEKAYRQYVSGWMFNSFGIQPALGRLLTETDDLQPGKHPYAVLSYDYWTHRFGRDPRVVGRTFHMGSDVYEILGVADKGFTGTEPGTVTDVFVPTMMHAGSIDNANSFWFRTLVRVKPGVAIEPLRTRLYSVYRALEQERAKSFKNLPANFLVGFPREKLVLSPAAAGVSQMQKEYRSALLALGILVLLVLLIACVNVANLMTAQAAARAQEMALRVSIGAGRLRLVQMVLVESLMMAFLAAGVGCLFAWWSTPFVVQMINPPDNPARLVLSTDWRVLGFGLALIVTVTLLFGLLPALRASAVKPVHALKGGSDPLGRRRSLHGMIAAQVAFCFLVVFVGGLFVTSFKRLLQVHTGFSADRVLALETVATPGLSPIAWQQMASNLRSIPGVEAVALAGWPLMSGTMSNDPISVHNAPPSDVLAFFLATSPGWLETMKIPLLDGRAFRANDINPQVAIVTRTFARQYFGTENPIGQSFRTAGSKTEYQIIGLAGDVVYRNIREPFLPVVFVPFQSAANGEGLQAVGSGTVLVRIANDSPRALEPLLRQEVHQARSEFRVSNIRTQQEIIDAQTLRERLLATLGVFFACVALLLAGIGLYGVLNYSVLQRRREIGIRIAIGAQRSGIARLVTGEIFMMVATGSFLGLVLGQMSARYIEALFYQVKPTDIRTLALPALAILCVALVATIPAIRRALRTNPAEILRSE